MGAIKTFNAANSGIFHDVFFARIDPLIGTLAHQGRLVKATQDQLEFSRVGVDISNGINTRDISLVVQRIINFNSIFFNI